MSGVETREDFLKAVVKVVDKKGEVYGLGFFIEINEGTFCVTFCHCINRIDPIFVQDWRYENYLCEFNEKYSRPKEDLVVLVCPQIHVHPFKFHERLKLGEIVSPLFFNGRTDNLPSIIDGGLIQDPGHFALIFPFQEGKGISSEPEKTYGKPWKIDLINSKTVYKIGRISGYSHIQPNKFDGGPVLTYDNNVVGMAIKVNQDLYCLPIEEVLSLFTRNDSQNSQRLSSDEQTQEQIGETLTPESAVTKDSVIPFTTTNEFVSDNPTDIDTLGRKSIAYVLSNRLQTIWKEIDTQQKNKGIRHGGFIINIDGPWGSGKTSLFNLLKNELGGIKDEKVKWITIEFNAWEHQLSNPPWWYFMDQVFRQGISQLSKISSKSKLRKRRAGLYIREHWWRLTVGRTRTIYIAIVSLILGAILISALVLLGDDSNQLSKYFTGISGSISLIISLFAGVYGIKNSLFPSTGDAARNFMRVDSQPTQHISRHFDFLIRKFKQPVLIFIDDLDRCNEEYVVKFIEAIQTLFRGPNVIFIVAADKRWIYTSFARAYNGFTSVNFPGKSIGFLFLEKIFQLSLTIPKVSELYKNKYLKELLKSNIPVDEKTLQNKAKDEVQKLDTPELLDELNKPKEAVYDQFFRQEAVKKLEEKESIAYTEHWLEKYSHLMEANPRGMKRLLNTFALYRAFLIIGTERLNYHDLAIWSILKLRWPELAEYIETLPDMIDNIGSSDENVLNKVPDNLRPLFTDSSVIDVRNAEKVGPRLSSTSLRKIIER